MNSHLSRVQPKTAPKLVPPSNPSFYGFQRPDHSRNGDPVGGLVIGGDYQGLGILDGEISIARFSRYTTFSERVLSLKDPDEAVRCILEVGRKCGLKGWVLFQTRDETMAAISRHREELTTIFRVPTPEWRPSNSSGTSAKPMCLPSV